MVFFLFSTGDNSRLLLGFRHPLNFVLIVNFIPLFPFPLLAPNDSLRLVSEDSSDDSRRHLTLIYVNEKISSDRYD